MNTERKEHKIIIILFFVAISLVSIAYTIGLHYLSNYDNSGCHGLFGYSGSNCYAGTLGFVATFSYIGTAITCFGCLFNTSIGTTVGTTARLGFIIYLLTREWPDYARNFFLIALVVYIIIFIFDLVIFVKRIKLFVDDCKKNRKDATKKRGK